MRAVLSDGTEIECGNFKALDSGVVLTKDRKRKKVVGFVPMAELRYVVPDDFEVAEGTRDDDAEGDLHPDAPDGTDSTGSSDSSAADDGDDPGLVDESTAVRFGEADGDTSEPRAGADDTATRTPLREDDYVELEADEHAGSNRVVDSELRALGGVGSASAARLEAAGYGTFADLAAADPERVASETDIPPGRARRWVRAAGDRLESEQSSVEDGGDGTDVGTDEGADTDDGDAVVEENET